jgi:hypothetical protein
MLGSIEMCPAHEANDACTMNPRFRDRGGTRESKQDHLDKPA